jgi:hypothetical protein
MLAEKLIPSLLGIDYPKKSTNLPKLIEQIQAEDSNKVEDLSLLIL